MERRGWIVQLYLIDQPEMGGIFWVKQSRIVEGLPSEGGTLARTDSLSPATAVRTLDGWLSTVGWTIGAGESRYSRPDLWGGGGENPPLYSTLRKTLSDGD